VSKVDYKHYSYTIDYNGCETNQEKESGNTLVKSKADRLRELKELVDEGILTQQEFEKQKKKILDE